MRIGVAGLGRMGAAMAARLIEVGHQVTVWNRSAAKAKTLVDAGAALAANPAALAAAVETVVTCLLDADAIDQVYGGATGLLAGDLTGKLVIDMKHGAARRPGRARREGSCQGRGVSVECPVGGSTGPARRQGKLIGLMGAEPADAARRQARCSISSAVASSTAGRSAPARS